MMDPSRRVTAERDDGADAQLPLAVQLARLLVHNDDSAASAGEAHDRMLVPLLPPFQASIGEEYVSLAMASVLDPVQRNLELIASLLMTMRCAAMRVYRSRGPRRRGTLASD